LGTVTPEAEAPDTHAPQPTSANSAGKVTGVVPVGHIERGPTKPQLSKGDAVLWNDSVVTERQGRARVVLDDGSILNVGSDSRLLVRQHNAKSQQTELFLAAGRMRAQVVKLTRSNPKFEVLTNTAVCGVLGTDFA